MERFVGRGAVNLSYPRKAVSIMSAVFVVRWSYGFPALSFGWGFWAFVAIKPERSEVQRVLRESCGAGVPTGNRRVPHCHQSPPGCTSLGYGRTLSSGVQGFSCSCRLGPYPALPVPVPQRPHLATARQHEYACRILSCGLEKPTSDRLDVALKDHFILTNVGLAQALGCFQPLPGFWGACPGPADLPLLGRSWRGWGLEPLG